MIINVKEHFYTSECQADSNSNLYSSLLFEAVSLTIRTVLSGRLKFSQNIYIFLKDHITQ